MAIGVDDASRVWLCFKPKIPSFGVFCEYRFCESLRSSYSGGKQRLILCLTNVLYHSHTLLFKHKKIPLSVVLRTRNVLIVEDHRTQKPEVHTIPGQMRYKVRVVRSGNHLKPRGSAI